MYADYLNELGVRQIIETDVGFITYRVSGNECYIIDIYVAPDKRKVHAASELADYVSEQAKKSGCTYLLGSVDLASKRKTESLKVLLAYGFKLAKCDEHSLFLTKDL
jgi:ribosomal protein S18 acetylase RimI-like enzyme